MSYKHLGTIAVLLLLQSCEGQPVVKEAERITATATSAAEAASEHEIIIHSHGDFSKEGLARVEVNDVAGYIDKNFKFAIRFQLATFETPSDFQIGGLQKIYDFSEGLAQVDFIENNKATGKFINKTGEIVIDDVGRVVKIRRKLSVSAFAEGLAIATGAGYEADSDRELLYGYVDRTGDFVIPARFRHAQPFSEGLALVSEYQSKWYYVDTEGNRAIEQDFSSENFWNETANSGLFSEGLVPVRPGKYFVPRHEKYPIPGATDSNPLYGYMDKKGKFIIPPRFEEARPFSEGLAWVAIDRDPEMNAYLMGAIDRSGKWVIEPQFKDALIFSEGLASVNILGRGECWKYIDKSGENAFPDLSCFIYAEPFSEGLAEVRARSSESGLIECGYVNRQGEIVVDLKFDICGDFSNGFAAVISRDGERGYVDSKGNFFDLRSLLQEEQIQ